MQSYKGQGSEWLGIVRLQLGWLMKVGSVESNQKRMRHISHLFVQWALQTLKVSIGYSCAELICCLVYCWGRVVEALALLAVTWRYWVWPSVLFCFVLFFFFLVGSGGVLHHQIFQNCHMFKLASYAVCSYCIQDWVVRYTTLKKLTHLQVHVMFVCLYVCIWLCAMFMLVLGFCTKLVGCSANFCRNVLVPYSGLTWVGEEVV